MMSLFDDVNNKRNKHKYANFRPITSVFFRRWNETNEREKVKVKEGWRGSEEAEIRERESEIEREREKRERDWARAAQGAPGSGHYSKKQRLKHFIVIHIWVKVGRGFDSADDLWCATIVSEVASEVVGNDAIGHRLLPDAEVVAVCCTRAGCAGGLVCEGLYW